ncbi:MAG: hypothetical protein GTO14_22090 [Anaerolineales bacterium]|nr:hypothetical protein [Anaerolineales bacterium]
MKTRGHIFRRPKVPGWMVLTGVMPSLGMGSPLFMERMLELVDLSWPPVCLALEAGLSEEFGTVLDDLETLLGVDVTVLDLSDMSPDEVVEAGRQSGLIVLAGGESSDWYNHFIADPIREHPETFIQQGRMFIAVGSAAGALGVWMHSSVEGDLFPGLGWLVGGIVLPGETAPMEIPSVRETLQAEEHSYAIGLPAGAILALGPDEEVEVWGNVKPVISLGKGWGTA